MASKLGFVVLYVALAISFIVANAKSHLPAKFFNVKKYGAVADGRTDNSQALLNAWDDACHHYGKSRVLIPEGTYKLGSVTFSGPCKARKMAFLIKGTLKAPTERSEFNRDTWIGFNYVNRLVVKGGGSLDGQGHSAWPYNDCSINPQCPTLPTTYDVTFNNIWGTSTSKVALALECSPLVPCRNINLEDINLKYFRRHGGPAESSCTNVFGKSSGKLFPPGCL